MKKLITVFCILMIVQAHAQFPRVDIPGSEVRKITSSIVSGQEYELHILLPGGYRNSTKKFPVVYLMDSQWDFPLVKSIIGQQYYDGFIPQIILVGVTWGGTNPNPDSLRARDYTPTNETRIPQSGGADKFLSFMKEELFPFIDANYKSDGKNRTLMGCSLGGLITMYALFTHTDMFTGYVAASPAYQWDREVIYKYEKAFYEKKLALPARLYMTIGDVERNSPGFVKFSKFLDDRHYSSVHIHSKVLENTGHSGTKSETFSRGLQYVFERPDLSLDAAILKKYAGSYQTANGGKIEITVAEKGLTVKVGGNNSYSLSAASETDFYSTAEFLNIYFKTDKDKVEGFQLDRFGNSQFIKKVSN